MNFSDDEFYFIALTIVKIILYILQVMIQTPLIIDGLRRCSNTLDSQGNFLKSKTSLDKLVGRCDHTNNLA